MFTRRTGELEQNLAAAGQQPSAAQVANAGLTAEVAGYKQRLADEQDAAQREREDLHRQLTESRERGVALQQRIEELSRSAQTAVQESADAPVDQDATTRRRSRRPARPAHRTPRHTRPRPPSSTSAVQDGSGWSLVRKDEGWDTWTVPARLP